MLTVPYTRTDVVVLLLLYLPGTWKNLREHRKKRACTWHYVTAFLRWHHLQLFTSECMLGPFARRCTTCRHQIVEHRLSAFHDRAVDRVHCHAPNSYRIMSGSAPLASLQLSWSIEILHHNIAWQALFIEAHSPYSMCGGGLRATHARSMNGLKPIAQSLFGMHDVITQVVVKGARALSCFKSQTSTSALSFINFFLDFLSCKGFAFILRKPELLGFYSPCLTTVLSQVALQTANHRRA